MLTFESAGHTWRTYINKQHYLVALFLDLWGTRLPLLRVIANRIKH